MKLLGRDLVEKFNKWPRSTIERIIGKPLPKEWDEKKLTSDFDVVIDEITNSSTYRMANFAQLQSLVAHGVQIPQSVLKETIDLPADVKEKWDKDIQQQQQSEMQKRQQDMQLEEKRIAAMYQGELQKVGLKNQGDKEVEGMGIQGDKEIKKMDIAGKMALEKIKQGQSRSRWQQSGGGFR